MYIAVMKSTIVFLGIQGYDYTVIYIKEKGFSVESISWKEADDLIKEYELPLAISNEFGKVFTNDKFKEYLNLHLGVKEQIIKVLNRLDQF